MNSAHEMKLFKTIDVENVNPGIKAKKKNSTSCKNLMMQIFVKDKIKFKVITKENIF